VTAVPGEYQKSVDRRKTLRPSPELLSRPVLPPSMLKTPLYRIEIVQSSFSSIDKKATSEYTDQ
jgi:hypothetical protein